MGLLVIIFVFVCIWVVDIGVYIMGKWLGCICLLDISLKKIVEGFFWGVGGSLLVGVLGVWYL